MKADELETVPVTVSQSDQVWCRCGWSARTTGAGSSERMRQLVAAHRCQYQRATACDGCRKLMPCVQSVGRDSNGDADGPDLCHVCIGTPDSDCDECAEWEDGE